MTLDEKKLLCGRLQALAPRSVVGNTARKYPAFGILRGSRFRVAVHVGRKGASFFTEDKATLDSLAAKGIAYSEYDQSALRDKKRYQFPSLTIQQVNDSEDSFRKLVSDSVAIKESGL